MRKNETIGKFLENIEKKNSFKKGNWGKSVMSEIFS